jgi:multisubunit Na+/H+ antiporter MnhB subunit
VLAGYQDFVKVPATIGPPVRLGYLYAVVCMPRRRQVYSSSTRVLSIAMIVIGVALVVRTLVAGGGAFATGLVLGILFMLAGGARLYLQLRG